MGCIVSFILFMKVRFFILFLCVFFLSGCFHEYFDHWDREHTVPVISTWELLPLTGNLIILPSKNELENLIENINLAQKRIWVETYTWTEKETQEAVLRAKKRWVDVRVILEGNVFETPRINDSIMNRLKENTIPAVFSNDKFTFTHMKMWIIDTVWCVSTGNWAYSSFTKNREFIYCSSDESILRSLEEIFLSDFEHIRPIFTSSWLDSRIGLAPLNLRKFLLQNIERAKKEIIVYNQAISDTEILEALSQKIKNWVHIELCQSSKSNTWSDYHDIPLFTSDSPYLHAKIFLIDTDNIIIWSANLTSNALDNNREIMIKIENNVNFSQQIKNLYNIDCK